MHRALGLFLPCWSATQPWCGRYIDALVACDMIQAASMCMHGRMQQSTCPPDAVKHNMQQAHAAQAPPRLRRPLGNNEPWRKISLCLLCGSAAASLGLNTGVTHASVPAKRVACGPHRRGQESLLPSPPARVYARIARADVLGRRVGEAFGWGGSDGQVQAHVGHDAARVHAHGNAHNDTDPMVSRLLAELRGLLRRGVGCGTTNRLSVHTHTAGQ